MHPRATNIDAEAPMLTNILSSLRVRSSSLTNTQGPTLHRLSYNTFAELGHACPFTQLYHQMATEVIDEQARHGLNSICRMDGS